MGFFDDLKDDYKKQQDKIAVRNETRGQRLAFVACKYLGGYETPSKSDGILTFYENQLEYKSIFGGSFTLDKSLVSEVSVEGKNEVGSRVTVTRLLTIGIFAFAAKKKTTDKEAFITIVLTDGREIVMQVSNTAPMQLKPKLSNVYAAYNKNKSQTSSTTQVSDADELEKLAILKEKGIITDAEFKAKKKQILGI
jgi:hypothetical protein